MTTNAPRRLGAIALLAVLVAVPLAAQTSAIERPGLAALLTLLDADGDGGVDRAEAEAARRALFDRLDRDGDGIATPGEIDAFRDAIRDLALMLDGLVGLRARALDADGDGVLAAAEFVDGGRLFARFDTDGDGRVTREEIGARASNARE